MRIIILYTRVDERDFRKSRYGRGLVLGGHRGEGSAFSTPRENGRSRGAVSMSKHARATVT